MKYKLELKLVNTEPASEKCRSEKLKKKKKKTTTRATCRPDRINIYISMW